MMFTGCYPFYALVYDIRPIKQQTGSSIRAFLSQKKIDTMDVFMLKREYILMSLKNELNHASIFNGDGLLINYDSGRVNKKCHGHSISFVENYSVTNQVMLDSGKTFFQERQKWIELSGGVIRNTPEPGKDLTVVYYWNTFSGNPNHKIFIRNLERVMQKRRDLQIRFYKVNQDIRQNAIP